MTITTCPTPCSAETDAIGSRLAAASQKLQRTGHGSPERAALEPQVRSLMADLEAARARLARGEAVQTFPFPGTESR